MREPVFQIEEVNDPVEIARCEAQDERARRNSDWLRSQWADLLPQARGKFVAVPGQQAFIADTPEGAWAMARAAYPRRQRRHGPLRASRSGTAHLCESSVDGSLVTTLSVVPAYEDGLPGRVGPTRKTTS